MNFRLSRVTAVIAALGLAPALTLAAGVAVRFDVSDPAASPFPSDRFTQPDFTQQHPQARGAAEARTAPCAPPTAPTST